MTAGAQDLHRLPGPRQRGGHLAHPGVAGTRVGIDLLQHRDLAREPDPPDRVLAGVERLVGSLGIGARGPAVTRMDRAYRRGRPPQGILREHGRVREAAGLAGDRAQAETDIGVERRMPEPPVIERERLALAVLEEEFAVVCPGERVIHQLPDPDPVEPGAIVEQFVGHGEIGHGAHLPAG